LFSAAGAAPAVPVLCYHSVEPQGDIYNVTPQRLREHFEYFKKQGYTVISPAQFKAASQGKALPSKPLMLTFDDGYPSFYTAVYPLLKEYRYPAAMFIISSWPDTAATSLTWPQIKEMDSSGLVTIGSHSHNLHHFAKINTYGDEGPLTETPPYENRYLTADEYSNLLYHDFLQSRKVLGSELGHPVQIMAWPYGAYNGIGQRAAIASGFEELFALDDTPNVALHNDLQAIRRLIVTDNPDAQELEKRLQDSSNPQRPHRIMQMDLDAVYDADPQQLERNIDVLTGRVQRAGADTVFLQAFNDSQGNGNTESVYFHTSSAPVKGDIFSHVVTRLKNAGRYRVYAWMPTMSAQWISNGYKGQAAEIIQGYKKDSTGWYHRATPFDPQTGRYLESSYADLALYNPIDGILFQDDMYMNDFEDFSSAGKAAYQQRFGRTLTPELIKDNASPAFNEWTDWKTTAITDLSKQLADTVHYYRPQAKMARNIYAMVVIDKGSQDWFSENYRQYLDTYDYVVAMAYPYMENQDFGSNDAKAAQWVHDFSHKAFIGLTPREQDKVVFKLQAYDWAHKRKIPAAALQEQTQVLYQQGAKNVAFYPEIDFAIPKVQQAGVKK
jgi:biofilm PGA synthesis lipoprotein PgaB